MLNMERRFKSVFIGPDEMLASMNRPGENVSSVQWIEWEGLEGATVVAVNWKPEYRAFLCVLYREDWEEVPPCVEVPHLSVTRRMVTAPMPFPDLTDGAK